jgi:hypothetical protein
MNKEELTALANQAAVESGLSLVVQVKTESRDFLEIWFSKESVSTLMVTIDTTGLNSPDSLKQEIKRRLSGHYGEPAGQG